MADGVIFVGWGGPVRGREASLQDVLKGAMEFWGRLQASGEIEGFDVVFLDAHGGDLGGFALLRGEREKLARLSTSEEWEQQIIRGYAVVENLGFVGGVFGDGAARRLAAIVQASASLAQN